MIFVLVFCMGVIADELTREIVDFIERRKAWKRTERSWDRPDYF